VTIGLDQFVSVSQRNLDLMASRRGDSTERSTERRGAAEILAVHMK